MTAPSRAAPTFAVPATRSEAELPRSALRRFAAPFSVSREPRTTARPCDAKPQREPLASFPVPPRMAMSAHRKISCSAVAEKTAHPPSPGSKG